MTNLSEFLDDVKSDSVSISGLDLDNFLQELKRYTVSLRATDNGEIYDDEKKAQWRSLKKELIENYMQAIEIFRQSDPSLTWEKLRKLLSDTIKPIKAHYQDRVDNMSSENANDFVEGYDWAQNTVRKLTLSNFLVACVFSTQDSTLINACIKKNRSKTKNEHMGRSASIIAESILFQEEGQKRCDTIAGISPFKKIGDAMKIGLRDAFMQAVKEEIIAKGMDSKSYAFKETVRRYAVDVLNQVVEQFNYDPNLVKEIGI